MANLAYHLITREALRQKPAGPKYALLYGLLREKILHRELGAGTKLPATRKLAQHLGVSRNTVIIAYEQLVAEGYIEARQGSGSYVADIGPPAVRRPGEQALGADGADRVSAFAERAIAELSRAPVIKSAPSLRFDFTYGMPPASRNANVQLKRHLGALPRVIGAGYDDPAGHAGLRRALADYLNRRRGIACDAEQIIVTSGAHQALDIVVRAATPESSAVLIEEPHYTGARAVFRAAGAQLHPCPVDADGLVVDQRESWPEGALVYVTPAHQFPLGGVLPVSRRLKLLDWARQHSALIVEDDYDSEFTYTAQPLEPLMRLDPTGHVIHLGTLSKSLCPSLRLGFLVAPEPLVDALRAVKWVSDRGSPSIGQMALAGFLDSGDYDKHLRWLSRILAARRDRLTASVERHLSGRFMVLGVQSGMHICLVHADDSALPGNLTARARRVGVSLTELSPYYLGRPDRQGFILGYGRIDEAEIEEGIHRLAAVLG